MFEFILIIVALALVPLALQILLAALEVFACLFSLPFRALNWAADKQVNSGTALVVSVCATIVFLAIFG